MLLMKGGGRRGISIILPGGREEDAVDTTERGQSDKDGHYPPHDSIQPLRKRLWRRNKHDRHLNYFNKIIISLVWLGMCCYLKKHMIRKRLSSTQLSVTYKSYKQNNMHKVQWYSG